MHEVLIRGRERVCEERRGRMRNVHMGYLVSVSSGKGVCGAETTCEGEDAREGWKWLVKGGVDARGMASPCGANTNTPITHARAWLYERSGCERFG
jgi:hypothetical protein